jgi:hypothetical protein
MDQSWGRIVARAWADEAFRRRLLAHPATVLKEHGFEVPPAVEVRVVESTPTALCLILPARRGAGELSAADLEAVVGGAHPVRRDPAADPIADPIGDPVKSPLAR